MLRGGQLRGKEVINARNAEHLGYISDIEFDERSGRLLGVAVMKRGFWRRILGIGEYTVPWSAVRAVSGEFILADLYDDET